MNINITAQTGRLTRDPELRQTTGGTAVCDLSVAVNHYNGDVSYFDVVCFGKQAEACDEYLQKGALVGVTGELKQERWETKDGQKRSRVKIIARGVEFGPRVEKSDKPKDIAAEPIDKKGEQDDLPF